MSKKKKKDHAWIPSGASRGQTHNFLSTNLPAAILVAALLIFWQAAAMAIGQEVFLVSYPAVTDPGGGTALGA